LFAGERADEVKSFAHLSQGMDNSRAKLGVPNRAGNAAIADELVNMNVDVILTAGGAATRVMQATLTISIVLAAAVDPVASGFVQKMPGETR